MDYPYRIWFCRKVPVADIEYKHGAPKTVNAPWFPTLARSIEKDGMMSPLLVQSKNGKIIVGTGHNRLYVIKELGWKYAPCVIHGEETPYEGIELFSMKEVQEYIRDGIVGRDGLHAGLRLNSAMLPEHEKYPSNPDPYYDIEE